MKLSSTTRSIERRLFMPAEWQTHNRSLMAWPTARSFENTAELRKAQKEIALIANAISRFEPVDLQVRHEDLSDARYKIGNSSSNITFRSMAIDQLWIRDTGPTFVRDQYHNALGFGIDFNFSHWGGKLSANEVGEDDRLLSHRLLSALNIPRLSTRLVCEGGSLEVDGEGTLMTTESAILNKNRNENLNFEEIESIFRELLGIRQFIWLKGLKDKDITDCHVDALARFLRPGVVLLSKPNPNRGRSLWMSNFQESFDILSKNERIKKVYILEEPDYSGHLESEDWIASYANYYLVNGGIIIPSFGSTAHDEEALRLFREMFPERKVVQLYINALPMSGGGIHCATQQIPANIPTK